jgi:hypothetical protein
MADEVRAQAVLGLIDLLAEKMGVEPWPESDKIVVRKLLAGAYDRVTLAWIGKGA